MDPWHGKLGVRFHRVSPSILSHSPCGLSSLVEYHFFSDPGPRNDHCPDPKLFSKRETSWAFDSHTVSLSFDPHELSLNIDMKMIRPVNYSGVTLDLNSNSWTLWLSCNVVNPVKIDVPLEFHWLTINSVQSYVFLWAFGPRQSVFTCHVWLRVLVQLSKTKYRIWESVVLCVLKTDDFFITNQR